MNAPTVHGPRDLPDLRAYLVDRWRPGGPYARVAVSLLSKYDALRAPNYARWEHDTLQSAKLWWVGADMVDLLMAAAAGIPDDVTVADLMLPSPAGMVVFEKGLLGIDADTGARTTMFNGFTWGGSMLPPIKRGGPGRPCVSLSWYRCLSYDDGLDPTDMNLALHSGALLDATVTLDDEHRPGGTDVALGGVRATGRLHGTDWVPLGRSDWGREQPLSQVQLFPMVVGEDDGPWSAGAHVHERVGGDEAGIASAQEDRRVLAALLTLVHQEGITTRVEHRPPRHVVRRAERAGTPAAASTVQVVTLRRPKVEHDDDGPVVHEGRTYSHRWLVNPHWRWQPYGPGRAQRRLIFIAPYVKGPPDKPLVTKEVVHSWVR